MMLDLVTKIYDDFAAVYGPLAGVLLLATIYFANDSARERKLAREDRTKMVEAFQTLADNSIVIAENSRGIPAILATVAKIDGRTENGGGRHR